MQFGNATPYYLDTSSFGRDIVITDARTGAILYRGSFTFLSGNAYTVAITNSGSGISLMSMVDTPCNNGSSGCVRAVNLSPNSGPVDIFFSSIGRVFPRLDPYTASDYRIIRNGNYRAYVSEALPCVNNNSVVMTNDYVECSNTRLPILDSTNLNIMSGVTYTLYIIGLAYQFPALSILPLESDLVY